ncbi:MAG: tetratricopeptide repeat protein [Bacteroidetes bacterium]|nr:MAG: tetratricopeptide repeat protein [Bacteroidota bacterium]TAG92106.1 MAG: tetratricopeptide repeat protein [Bacteroidota bacterium]
MKQIFLLYISIFFGFGLMAQNENPNFEEAKKNMQDGNYTKAIKLLNKTIKDRPEWAEAYLKRGQAYYELNKYKEMVKDCEKALELDKNLIQAHFNLGIAKYNLKDYTNAIVHLTIFLEKIPNDAEAMGWRGMSNFYLKNKKLACKDWETAIYLGNSYVKPYYNKNCQEENASQGKD